MSQVKNETNLSDAAVAAIMMALQKSLMEQSDIVPTLKGFRFRLSNEGLVIMNPPIVKLEHDGVEEYQETNAEV